MGTGEGILVMLGGVLLAAAGPAAWNTRSSFKGPAPPWLAACDGQHAGYADIWPRTSAAIRTPRCGWTPPKHGGPEIRAAVRLRGSSMSPRAGRWELATTSPCVVRHARERRGPAPVRLRLLVRPMGLGQVQVGAGTSSVLGEHALLWSGTAASVVDLHPVGFAASRAGGVWGNRQVGYGVPQTDSNDISWRALLWSGTAESVVNLHPAGFRWSCASDTWGVWQVGRACRTMATNDAGPCVVRHGRERREPAAERRPVVLCRAWLGRPTGRGGGRPRSAVVGHGFERSGPAPVRAGRIHLFRGLRDRRCGADRGVRRERIGQTRRPVGAAMTPYIDAEIRSRRGISSRRKGRKWRDS
jgi:hypothetical protein